MEPTCAELCVVTTPLEFYEFNRPHTRQTLVERVPCRYGVPARMVLETDAGVEIFRFQ